MGKWIYVKEIATPISELKKINTQLINASLKTKVDVQIQFSSRNGGGENLRQSVDVSFFRNDKTFFFSFYVFTGLEKNKKAVELCKKLMKEPDEWDEIKAELKSIV